MKNTTAMNNEYIAAWKDSGCWWGVYAMGWNVYDGALFVTREDIVCK